MNRTLTNEELDILHKILPCIPLNEEFEVYSIIVQNIIKPQYPNGKGGTNLSQSDPARKDYTDRGIFKNIDDFLTEYYFADKVGEHNRNNVLKLTQRGQVLCAYGNIYAFEEENQPSEESEIIERVPYIISKAFPYGEFIIEIKEPRINIVNIHIANVSEENREKFEEIKRNLDPRERIKKKYKQLLQDEEVLQYLVNHGFAVNRHDIKTSGNLIYRQLTDKGRTLKELGSIEAFNNYQKINKEKNELQDRRVGHLYWINFWIAVGTVIVGVYTVFQLFDYFNNHTPSWQLASYFLLGIIAGVITTFVVMKLLKLRKSKSVNRQA